jgi:hypothetical protein
MIMSIDDCWDLFVFLLFLFVMTQTLDTRTVSEDLTIGPTITSGGVYLATNSSRTGLINIGHTSSSGIISINAGTSKINLRASNYDEGTIVLGISDQSGNNATVAVTDANNYIRMGSIVTIAMQIDITDLTGLVLTDEVRITGLPYAHHASDIHMLAGITGTAFNGINVTDLNVFSIPSTTTCSLRGTRFVNSINLPVLVSDVTTGTLRSTITYFTEVVV